jgi:Fe-S-cluster-containing hydrogenase component 2
MLHKTGVPTKEQVSSVFFDDHTLSEYKAIIECYEDIPCNPCVTSCPVKAISMGPTIHNQPKLNPDLCIGCSICVTSCPGLAIILAKVNDDKAFFKIAYEMNGVFEKDMIVSALNRSGEVIGEGRIISILNHPRQLKTQLIEVEVDRSLLHDFITIKEKIDG